MRVNEINDKDIRMIQPFMAKRPSHNIIHYESVLYRFGLQTARVVVLFCSVPYRLVFSLRPDNPPVKAIPYQLFGIVQAHVIVEIEIERISGGPALEGNVSDSHVRTVTVIICYLDSEISVWGCIDPCESLRFGNIATGMYSGSQPELNINPPYAGK